MVTTLNKVLYTAEASTSADGTGTPPAATACSTSMSGSPRRWVGTEGGTNPEQLFAAGYAACFQSALGVVSRRQKVDTTESTVTARVSIGPIDGGAFGLSVAIAVAIPDVGAELAQQLVEAAHQVCPYSNATRGNIEVALSVVP